MISVCQSLKPLFVITHSEHEESVKFYYTARNDFSSEKQFLDEIDQREGVKFSEQRVSLTKDAISHVMTGDDFQSFIQHQAVIFDQDNIEGVVIEDQWNL
jgi:hypothetical protein